MHETRCVRGSQCEDRQAGVDPMTGGLVPMGQVTQWELPLCPTCIRYVRYAVNSLPWDVAELTLLLHPSAAIRLRDPQLPSQPRVKKHAPLPFNGSAEALRAYIDHEATAWAEVLVAESDGGDWDPQWAITTRIGYRVQHFSALIADNLLLLLSLPARRRAAYSTGDDFTHGHLDAEDATVRHGAVWRDRSGADAALTFLKIHDMVAQFAGRVPSDRLPIPCRHCHRQALHREYPDGPGKPGNVICRTCWVRISDDEYAQYTDALTNLIQAAAA